MGYPVVHFEITGTDATKLHAFYGELFDWEINADNPWNYGMVHANGEGGIGGGIGGGEETSVTFYVEVPDLDVALKKAEGLGGSTVVPPTEIPGVVTFALFADPDGNRIGLVKRDAN